MLLWGAAWCGLPTPAAAQVPPVRVGPNLAAQLRYLELRISSGRVVVGSERSNRQISATSQNRDMREQLTMNLGGEAPTINYELTTSTHRFALDIVDGNRITLLVEPRGESSVVPIVFEQPASGPISVRVGGAEDPRVLQASSLWLLLMQDPAVGQLQVAPLLEALRSDWQLMATTEGIRQAMFRNRESLTAVEIERWQRWVVELASDEFSLREQAERSLRELGPVALPFLRGLEPERLDTEQLYRVRRLLRQLEQSIVEDTAESVALWLAADPRAWLAALTQTDSTRQRAAAEQIARLIGQPVEFDPAADLETRDRQLQRIQAQIDTFAPLPAPSGKD